MNTLTINNVDANTALDYKNQLLVHGLVADVDFTWKYTPKRPIENTFFMTTDSKVEFIFTDGSNATLFSLKWL
jgi:hypothetical protein